MMNARVSRWWVKGVLLALGRPTIPGFSEAASPPWPNSSLPDSSSGCVAWGKARGVRGLGNRKKKKEQRGGKNGIWGKQTHDTIETKEYSKKTGLIGKTSGIRKL